MPKFSKYTDEPKHWKADIVDTEIDNLTNEENLLLLTLQRKAKLNAENSIEYGFNLPIKEFYRRMYALPSQRYGSRIERFLSYRLGYSIVSSRDGRGDYTDGDNFYEAKVSMSDESVFNLVQIRTHHNLAAYFLVFIQIIPENDFDVIEHIFKVPADDMHAISDTMGLAHGTLQNTIYNENIERRKTLKIGDDFWLWLQKYRIEGI